MLSLSNSMNIDDVRDFILKIHNDFDKKIKFTRELKFDGLALSLIYTNGNLIRAVTEAMVLLERMSQMPPLQFQLSPKKLNLTQILLMFVVK